MAKDEKGLTSEELVGTLQFMDQMLTEENWIADVGALDAAGKQVDPADSLAQRWSIQGAAWNRTQKAFPYRQVCMALHYAMNRPMVLLQEHEAGLTFTQMKEWLAAAIEYAKNNDPWTPYLIQHPERLR